MQCMVGSLALIVGHCCQEMISAVSCVCSEFRCLGQYPYNLIVDILLRCFPLIIMLDWQCMVGSLAPISWAATFRNRSAVSRLFKMFYPCFYEILVMHTSLCHVALQSGIHQLCFLSLFGTDSQQLHKQDSMYSQEFPPCKHFVFTPNFWSTCK